jgi:hypothetical protein
VLSVGISTGLPVGRNLTIDASLSYDEDIEYKCGIDAGLQFAISFIKLRKKESWVHGMLNPLLKKKNASRAHWKQQLKFIG